MTRLLLVISASCALVLSFASPAAAHPLGNFTTNRYARVEVGADVVRVHYVLDEAELVAVRQRGAIEVEGVPAYRARRVEEIRRGLRLMLDGDVVELQTRKTLLAQPDGQGGLSTLRIEALFEAPLSGTRLSFEDTNTPDLVGWREVVAGRAAGASLDRDAPTLDRTNGLRSYPTDPGVAPLDVRSVEFGFTPGHGDDGAAAFPDTTTAARRGSGDRFADLLESTTSSPFAVAGALVAAFAFGIVHALGPGHGKTVMAAYLVSTQGRRRDAFALGAVVSLMHTASVLLLAGVLATFGQRMDVARVYPVLTVAAGTLVVGVGIRLVAQRARARTAEVRPPDHQHDHDHDHDRDRDHREAGHGADRARAGSQLDGGVVAVLARPAPPTHHHVHHDSHDSHVHGPGGHTHELPSGVRPLSKAGILALGTSGGLFPSPSAVVLLVGAFAVGRAALGLAMIAAFSLGLAAMLVGVGLLLVAGRDRLARSRLSLQLPWLPVAGAVAIVALGAVLVVQGASQLR